MAYGLGQFGDGSGNYRPSDVDGKRPPKETTILNNAVKEANKKFKNIFIVKIHGSGYQRSGLPDVYVAINGKSLWVEFKRPGADTTKLQKRTLEKLDKAGIYCGTAESTETFLEMISHLLN
jgi:hypothetical protein